MLSWGGNLIWASVSLSAKRTKNSCILVLWRSNYLSSAAPRRILGGCWIKREFSSLFLGMVFTTYVQFFNLFSISESKEFQVLFSFATTDFFQIMHWQGDRWVTQCLIGKHISELLTVILKCGCRLDYNWFGINKNIYDNYSCSTWELLLVPCDLFTISGWSPINFIFVIKKVFISKWLAS